MNTLTIHQLSYAYANHTVLPGLSLALEQGLFACILGPSGSGKTTLLRLIAGLEPWQGGTIALGGNVLSGPHDAVAPEKRGVGMVFQQPVLFPTLTVAENIAFGLRNTDPAVAQKRVSYLLEHVGLSERAHHYAHQLSGGQQHRVALARALAPEVKLLLLDEPFAHLDPSLRQQLGHDTRKLVKEAGVTCLMVTHDASEAMRLADVLFLLDANGKLHQSGSPHDVYHHPSDAYAAQALGEINLLSAVADGATASCVLGDKPLATPERGKMQAAIRPHDIIVQAGEMARIVAITCMGAEDRLLLKLDSGEDIVAMLPYGHGWKVGDKAALSARSHRLHFFPIP